MDNVRSAIRDIPDFPAPGIIFKDLTPVFKDASLFKDIIAKLASLHKEAMPDYIVGIESRGFIIGAPLALELGCGFIPVRKKGKLPYKTIEASYDLEYGKATIEVHSDALKRGDKVVVVDDLLATGGTAAAAIGLINRLEAQILSIDFIVELAFLKGRSKLIECDVNSLVLFD